ncbi:MAG: MBL fold metallo-hydrolase [Myxococcota bacterium]
MDAVANALALFAVRTPTLPPATHTNTWIVGDPTGFTVVDPASPYEDEQQRLFGALADRIRDGARIRRLLLTHHHADHVSGAVDLQRRLRSIGHDVPIAAHPVTAELVRRTIPVDEPVADGARLEQVVALLTPGHAPGHLVLHAEDHGWTIAGDMVAGIGTIVIDPDEGDLQDYLDSLELLRRLGTGRLMPAHGPVIEEPEAVLSHYIAHRNHRTDQIRAALIRSGPASTPLALAPLVYPELPATHHPLAAIQIRTHLNWLRRRGLAHETAGAWSA